MNTYLIFGIAIAILVGIGFWLNLLMEEPLIAFGIIACLGLVFAFIKYNDLFLMIVFKILEVLVVLAIFFALFIFFGYCKAKVNYASLGKASSFLDVITSLLFTVSVISVFSLAGTDLIKNTHYLMCRISPFIKWLTANGLALDYHIPEVFASKALLIGGICFVLGLICLISNKSCFDLNVPALLLGLVHGFIGTLLICYIGFYLLVMIVTAILALIVTIFGMIFFVSMPAPSESSSYDETYASGIKEVIDDGLGNKKVIKNDGSVDVLHKDHLRSTDDEQLYHGYHGDYIAKRK